MYCRSRPQYRSDLGWILGVAFLGTLTRSARPAQGFTYVRCCSAPPASSPHDLAAPGRIVSRRPHCVLRLRLLPTWLRRGLEPPIQVHAWHTNPRPCGREPGGFRVGAANPDTCLALLTRDPVVGLEMTRKNSLWRRRRGSQLGAAIK